MTAAVAGLVAANRPQEHHVDDDSAHGDNEHMLGNAGRGRGALGQPRHLHMGARRVPREDDDGLGRPKLSIPRFEGTTDVEEYLTWELKIEKLWRLHDYSEDKKVKLASAEFDGYALRWWDNLVTNRRDDHEVPVLRCVR